MSFLDPLRLMAGKYHKMNCSADFFNSATSRFCIIVESALDIASDTVLFVTRKTVETHLGHIYHKLGVPGRGQLGRALAEQTPTAGG